MSQRPVFAVQQPFMGESALPEPETFEILDESFEDEFGRGVRAPRRPPPPRRGAARLARPARSIVRPPRPRPLPKPPRWPPPWPSWRPFGTGYEPLVVAEPPGFRFAGAGALDSDAQQLRCVRQCLSSGPAPAPQPEPDATSAGSLDAAGDGAERSPAESEFDESEGELGDLIGRIGSGIRRIGSGVGQAIGRLGESLRECRIIDLTAQSDHSVRKGRRDPKSVYALVLHQMACCFRRRDPLRSYLRIKAHFAILPEGQILQLHPVSALIWASHGFNNRSVAVEFAGNFPNTRGRWWKGETYGRNRVTPAQLEAGRCLVRHLIRTMGLRVVLAHRQSSDMRENDPGPDIWYHVGQWAVDNLGLSDGGPGFKVGSGKPIPDEWRTWGRRSTSTPELEFAAVQGEDEGELWRGAPEGEVGLEVALPDAIADPRSAGPGIYTLYRNRQRLYVGRASNLRRRLQQHLWCLTHLGVGATGYTVKLTPMRGASPAQLGRVEAAVIERYGRRGRGGRLTNVKARELEQELFG